MAESRSVIPGRKGFGQERAGRRELEETLGGVGCVCYLNYADFMDTHISKSMKLYTFCAVYFMPLLLQ